MRALAVITIVAPGNGEDGLAAPLGNNGCVSQIQRNRHLFDHVRLYDRSLCAIAKCQTAIADQINEAWDTGRVLQNRVQSVAWEWRIPVQSRKVQAIRAAGWLSLCAQHQAWPYQYVTASGPAAITGPASYPDQRAMAVRYLGQAGAEEYMASVTASGEADAQIVIEMTPRIWLSADYTKL